MSSTFRVAMRTPGSQLGSGKVLTLVALACVLCACQKSSHEQLADARNHLATGAYDESIAAAKSGLQSDASKADAWGLELVKLEAYARGGSGELAKQQLIALAHKYAAQLSATDYSSTAQQLKEAESGTAAIEVLDLGKKRFPDDAMIDKMIAESVSQESSPEELEMLRSLGYIE